MDGWPVTCLLGATPLRTWVRGCTATWATKLSLGQFFSRLPLSTTTWEDYRGQL